MNIIFENEHVVSELKKHYTLLELETVRINDHDDRTAYCVLDAEDISPELLYNLDAKITLHQQFIESYKNSKYEECAAVLPFLKGQLGGGMDSFYEIMAQKLPAVNSV